VTTETETRALRRHREGKVIGTKMDKTIVVRVERRMRHRQYGKEMTRNRKYYAHDEASAAGVGDVVRIMETRPYSKLKRWRLTEVVRKA
jgi:small subunit ribosomal protein S17